MGDSKEILNHCLYFSTGALARTFSKMADEEFRITGLSPSHAFLLMVVVENEGIGAKDLSKKLEIAPSTVTRFIDYLEIREYLTRTAEGKSIYISAAPKGQDLYKSIKQAWKNLYDRYVKILGDDFSDELLGNINKAVSELS